VQKKYLVNEVSNRNLTNVRIFPYQKRELIPMNSKQEMVRWFNSFCEYYDGLYSYEEREEVLDLNVEVLLEVCKKYK
jgi:hypothetical protein